MASKSGGGAVDLPAFFADLVRCETRLYNALNDRLRERHGIVTSQFEFLRFLRDHPGARVADLAAEFAVGIGATSKGVDRLEKQGWVVRQPNPSDRRSSLLALTDDGLQLVDAAEETFTEGLAELIGGTLDSCLGVGRRTGPLEAALRARTRPDRHAHRLTSMHDPACFRLVPSPARALSVRARLRLGRAEQARHRHQVCSAARTSTSLTATRRSRVTM